MINSFTVLWTKERCRWLQRVGDSGPLSVVYGGPHLSMPAIEHVKAGDTIFPIYVADCTLYVIAGMRVGQVVPADDFVRQRLGIVRSNLLWDEMFATLREERPALGHLLPFTCADQAAVGEAGSEIRFDRAVPGELLQDLRLGPTSRRERPLKGVADGRLASNLSFHGHVRRLGVDSAASFAALVGPLVRLPVTVQAGSCK